MDREDRLRIKKNYELLVKDLGPLLKNILDAFLGQGIINMEMRQEIESPQTEFGKNRELLRKMLTISALKNEHLVFKTFCDALERNASEDMANTLRQTDVSEEMAVDSDDEGGAAMKPGSAGSDNSRDGGSGDGCSRVTGQRSAGNTYVISNSKNFHIGDVHHIYTK